MRTHDRRAASRSVGRGPSTLDPGAPGLAPPPAGHVVPPYGLSGTEGLEDERIQDLLRQEDAARRGSSCIN